MDNKFTHIAVEKPTQRKIALLAKSLDVSIYSLVEYMADLEWKNALKRGVVTDAMLQPSAHQAEKAS